MNCIGRAFVQSQSREGLSRKSGMFRGRGPQGEIIGKDTKGSKPGSSAISTLGLVFLPLKPDSAGRSTADLLLENGVSLRASI